jgi:hypothetical protein
MNQTRGCRHRLRLYWQAIVMARKSAMWRTWGRHGSETGGLQNWRHCGRSVPWPDYLWGRSRRAKADNSRLA